jgi:hypothetical protein
MMLMKRGTIVLAVLFLGVAIIGFTLEVSVLVALNGQNSQVGCWMSSPLDGTAAGRLYRSISTIRNTSTVAYCYDRRSCCHESQRQQTTSPSVPRHRTGSGGNIVPLSRNNWLSAQCHRLSNQRMPPQYFHRTTPRIGMSFTPDWQ